MRILLFGLGLCLLPWLTFAQASAVVLDRAPEVDSISLSLADPDAAPPAPLSIAPPADTLIDPFFDPAFKSDTLPPILMKTEPSLVALSIVGGMFFLPGAYLYVGCHSYSINGKKKYVPSVVKPYLLATRDQNLQELYKRHRQNRITWYTATSGGLFLAAVGFVQAIISIIDPNYGREGATLLLLGTGLTVGGQVARIISFSQLRKAVNLYNTTYANTNAHRRVSLHLGLPSRTPAGGALYLRF